MKNIPVYVGASGTATLILAEIPHRQTAYIMLRTVTDGGLRSLIGECAGFCRGCGADTVLVSREQEPLDLPHAYDMLLLHTWKAALPPVAEPLELVPMTPDNDAVYQRIYNICFRDVENAATYDRAQIRRIYERDQAAFLAMADRDTVCGMGELHDSELAAIGLLPEFRGRGLSRRLALSLLHRCLGPEITLTAVSTNTPALRLYDSLGFTVAGLISRWYLV